MGKRYLTEYIDEAFRLHVETDQGLICGSDRLLVRISAVVAAWIEAEEEDYQRHGSWEAADILSDLRQNLIEKPNES